MAQVDPQASGLSTRWRQDKSGAASGPLQWGWTNMHTSWNAPYQHREAHLGQPSGDWGIPIATEKHGSPHYKGDNLASKSGAETHAQEQAKIWPHHALDGGVRRNRGKWNCRQGWKRAAEGLTSDRHPLPFCLCKPYWSTLQLSWSKEHITQLGNRDGKAVYVGEAQKEAKEPHSSTILHATNSSQKWLVWASSVQLAGTMLAT